MAYYFRRRRKLPSLSLIWLLMSLCRIAFAGACDGSFVPWSLEQSSCILTPESGSTAWSDESAANCHLREDYVVKKVDETPLSTIMMATSVHGLSDDTASAPSLKIGFTNTEPHTSATPEVSHWLRSSIGDSSQQIDVSHMEEFGKYLVAKFECDLPPCRKVTLDFVSCFDQPHAGIVRSL